MSFQLSCESTVDLSYEYVQKRNISVLFYTYIINGKEYVDNMGRSKEALSMRRQPLEYVPGAMPIPADTPYGLMVSQALWRRPPT